MSYVSLHTLAKPDHLQLTQMNPYPDTRSVLVLDNSRIRDNKALAPLVQAAGCLILYLPAYSPDLNPVEESFIAGPSLYPYSSQHPSQVSSPTFSKGIPPPTRTCAQTRARSNNRPP